MIAGGHNIFAYMLLFYDIRMYYTIQIIYRTEIINQFSSYLDELFSF